MAKRAVKVVISGDTTKYEESVKKANGATKKFAKGTRNATNSIASAFGVNLGPVNSALDSMQQGFLKFNNSIKASSGGAKVFQIAMNIVKKALISTGIGAIVIAFGALLAYFTRTQEGADTVKRAMAGLGAIMDVIVDRLSALGKKMVWAFNHPKEAIHKLWLSLKKNIVNRFTALPRLINASLKLVAAIFKGGSKEAINEYGNSLRQALLGIDDKQAKKIKENVKSIGKEMRDESKAAMALKKEEQQLEKDEIAFITRKEQLLANISKYRLASRDEENNSAAERLRMTKLAMAAQKQLSSEEIEMTNRKISILKRQQALANNMNKDDRELALLKAKAINLDSQLSTGLRTLMRDYNRLTKEVKKNEEATKDLNSLLLTPIASKKAVKVTQEVVNKEGKRIPVVFEPKLETEKLQSFTEQNKEMAEKLKDNYKGAFIDISDSVQGGVENIAVGVGELLGSLNGHGDLFKGFALLVANTFADMAIQVGKIAIATGIATIGIKAALETLNPAVAIAAGVALVALGTAVKGALGDVASNPGGGGSTSSIGGNFDVRKFPNPRDNKVQVEVTGEFRQRAGDLVATVQQEQQRQRILT